MFWFHWTTKVENNHESICTNISNLLNVEFTCFCTMFHWFVTLNAQSTAKIVLRRSTSHQLACRSRTESMTIFACDPVNSPESKFCHFHVLMHSIGNGSVESIGVFFFFFLYVVIYPNISLKPILKKCPNGQVTEVNTPNWRKRNLTLKQLNPVGRSRHSRV